jgi:hypothetical protein
MNGEPFVEAQGARCEATDEIDERSQPDAEAPL